MKTLFGNLLFVVILTTAQASEKDGFVSMFDGKTLKGWEATPARTAGAEL